MKILTKTVNAKVLLVDPVSVTRSLDKNCLELKGYRVSKSRNLKEASELLKKNTIDLLIVDNSLLRTILDIEFLSLIFHLSSNVNLILAISFAHKKQKHNPFISKMKFRFHEIRKPISNDAFIKKIEEILLLKTNDKYFYFNSTFFIDLNFKGLKCRTFAKNLSNKGVFIPFPEFNYKLKLFDYLVIRFKLDDSEIEVGGNIVSLFGNGYGIRFVDLGFQKSLKEVEDFILRNHREECIFNMPFYL